jgi:AAHS family benzoate transporter-like MFS transporter
VDAPEPDPPSADPAPIRHASPLKNPWWIPPFLGGVPPVEPRLVRLLGLVTLGIFFEQYDLSLLSAAIKQITADLEIGVGESGYYLSAIRFGGFLTFAIVPFADRLGRRRIFLVSLVGMSIGTLGSGLSPNALTFVLFQVIARAFMLAAIMVAVVILIEEYPPAHRGWAIGVLGAVGGFGFGLGAVIFSLIDVLPYGWRAMYALGVVPLLLLPLFRRELVETARFERQQRAGAGEDVGQFASVLALARDQPRRALALGAATFFAGMGSIAVFQYASLLVQNAHGWAPWQYSTMIIAGGGVGMFGNLVAGRLGDRLGRRRVGLIAYGFFPLFAILFYLGPSGLLWLAFAGFVFCNSAGEVVTRAFAGELFATSQRGAATGWISFTTTLGWTMGLFVIGLGTSVDDDLAAGVGWLALVVAFAGGFLLMLPETRRRQLEEISGDA